MQKAERKSRKRGRKRERKEQEKNKGKKLRVVVILWKFLLAFLQPLNKLIATINKLSCF